MKETQSGTRGHIAKQLPLKLLKYRFWTKTGAIRIQGGKEGIDGIRNILQLHRHNSPPNTSAKKHQRIRLYDKENCETHGMKKTSDPRKPNSHGGFGIVDQTDEWAIWMYFQNKQLGGKIKTWRYALNSDILQILGI